MKYILRFQIDKTINLITFDSYDEAYKYVVEHEIKRSRIMIEPKKV